MGTNLFGEIVRRVEIESIHPISYSVERGFPDAPEPRQDLALDESSTCALSEDRRRLIVDYEFRLRSPTDLGEGSVFQARIVYRVTYGFDPELTPEHEKDLDLFAKHNARFNTWPMLREFLLRVTAEFDLPRLTLPLLKPYAPAPTNDSGEGPRPEE